jgi:hypothetical protein
MIMRVELLVAILNAAELVVPNQDPPVGAAPKAAVLAVMELPVKPHPDIEAQLKAPLPLVLNNWPLVPSAAGSV